MWVCVFENSIRSCLVQSGVAGVSYGIWRWEQCNGGMSRPLLGVRQLTTLLEARAPHEAGADDSPF